MRVDATRLQLGDAGLEALDLGLVPGALLGFGVPRRLELALQAGGAFLQLSLARRGRSAAVRLRSGSGELGLQPVALGFRLPETGLPVARLPRVLALEPGSPDQPADGEAKRRGDHQKGHDLQEEGHGPSPFWLASGAHAKPGREHFGSSYGTTGRRQNAQASRAETGREGSRPARYSAALGRSGNRNSRPTLTLGSPSYAITSAVA